MVGLLRDESVDLIYLSPLLASYNVLFKELPRTCATARPQLAKADTAFQAHPLVNRLNLA